MHRLSMAQALSIWSDLEAAYYGKHCFGSDTAEIYMYRFTASNPRAEAARTQRDPAGLYREGLHEQARDANEALYSLFQHFAKTREARIEVNGKELGDWLKTAGFGYLDRVHVKVTHAR